MATSAGAVRAGIVNPVYASLCQLKEHQYFPDRENLAQILKGYEGYIVVVNPQTTGLPYSKTRDAVIEIAAKEFAQTTIHPADVPLRTAQIVQQVKESSAYGTRLSDQDVEDIIQDVVTALLTAGTRKILHFPKEQELNSILVRHLQNAVIVETGSGRKQVYKNIQNQVITRVAKQFANQLIDHEVVLSRRIKEIVDTQNGQCSTKLLERDVEDIAQDVAKALLSCIKSK